MNKTRPQYVLTFDTANEVVAIGVGVLDAASQSVDLIASREVEARRQSNTQLLPQINDLLRENNIDRTNIACVVCGRGPGSFTGVRIAMATAKGMASALEVPLWGVSSLDAVAWNNWACGVRGRLTVIADAMRKEVYPVRFDLDDQGVVRLDADTVIKADEYATTMDVSEYIAGDGLGKYADLFESRGSFVAEDLWTPTGQGLLLAFQEQWHQTGIDPLNRVAGNPALLLPTYTRLSDAEENERIRLSKNDPKNLTTGVQHEGIRHDQIPQEHDTAIANAREDESGIVYRPLDEAHVADVVHIEAALMGSSAWRDLMVREELPRKDRSWWTAFANDELVGYAGGMVCDGQLQILKVAVEPDYQRRGIAKELIARVAEDARGLGAQTASLEVRASNTGAQAFYKMIGLESVGTRPGYYSDGEDALIMQGPLPTATNDVAGMALQSHTYAYSQESKNATKPLILAIETSCDETAAAVVEGKGTLVSDVLASQIDFHARFGGVVPEIASRKHTEAICGVAEQALKQAAFGWKDLDAIAATYAPGLVGALVVGVAFSKAAAWALDIPYIQVNHLEGHIYANKTTTPDLEPPMVVSLVSGGHTMLVEVKDWGNYHIMGETLDDAVGEAFDKVAKALGLGYPGGPAISKHAQEGRANAIDFPRAMLHSGDLKFSLSGLKTAVITYINEQKNAGNDLNIPDIAASFQQAVIDVQVAKAKTALKQTSAKEFCLGGGVAANQELRRAYETMCEKAGVRLTLPPLSACTDNAGMIALVAHDRYKQEKFAPLNADAQAQANLEEPY